MDSSELSDVAWDLVDHCRAALSIAELNTAFVRLGVGDYAEAMVIALKSVVRADASPLPDRLRHALARLGKIHYFDKEFLDLLAVVMQAGTDQPGR